MTILSIGTGSFTADLPDDFDAGATVTATADANGKWPGVLYLDYEPGE